MDSSNRLFIVFCACAWIVAMAVIIFLTWAAPDRTINRLGDFVQFLSDNNTDAGKLVVTLAALGGRHHRVACDRRRSGSRRRTEGPAR